MHWLISIRKTAISDHASNVFQDLIPGVQFFQSSLIVILFIEFIDAPWKGPKLPRHKVIVFAAEASFDIILKIFFI